MLNLLKVSGYLLLAFIFCWILIHPWTWMTNLERYIAFHTLARKVKVRMVDIDGHPSKYRYNEMHVTIMGSSDYLFYAFNPYVDRDRFDNELEKLALKIENRLRKKNKIESSIIRITVSTGDYGGLNPNGARTKSYFHFIED